MIHEGDVVRCDALGVESLEVCEGMSVDVKLSVHVVRDARNVLTDIITFIIVMANMCHTNAAGGVDDSIIPTVDRGSLRVR